MCTGVPEPQLSEQTWYRAVCPLYTHRTVQSILHVFCVRVHKSGEQSSRMSTKLTNTKAKPEKGVGVKGNKTLSVPFETFKKKKVRT